MLKEFGMTPASRADVTVVPNQGAGADEWDRFEEEFSHNAMSHRRNPNEHSNVTFMFCDGDFTHLRSQCFIMPTVYSLVDDSSNSVLFRQRTCATCPS